jgi:hypothetical protein
MMPNDSHWEIDMSDKASCAVCGEQVTQGNLEVEYAGERQSFCCRYCQVRFIEDCELDSIQRRQGLPGPLQGTE